MQLTCGDLRAKSTHRTENAALLPENYHTAARTTVKYIGCSEEVIRRILVAVLHVCTKHYLFR